MKIGYARVWTQEQNLDLQRDALKSAGCSKIIEDTVSGGKDSRPGIDRMRELLRKGDVLVVWRLDRLGRSLRHLIDLMTELEGQGVGFQSVTEAIDTTTPGGTERENGAGFEREDGAVGRGDVDGRGLGRVATWLGTPLNAWSERKSGMWRVEMERGRTA